MVLFTGKGDHRRARKQSKDKWKGGKHDQTKAVGSSPLDTSGDSKGSRQEGEGRKRPRPPAEDFGDGGERQLQRPSKDKKKNPVPPGAAEEDGKAARLASYAKLELRPGKSKAETKQKSQARVEEKPTKADEGPKLSRAQKKNLRRSMKRAEKRGGGDA